MNALQGKTLLLTRSAEANERDAAAFLTRGVRVRSVPSIQFIEPDSWAECDRAILNLRKYDGSVFTSVNAVRFFLKRINAISAAATGVMASQRIFAVGGATRQALEEAGVSVTPVADAGSAGALADSIGKDAAGRCFLFPKSDIARNALPSALRANDAVVDEVVVYKTVAPDVRDLDAVRGELLRKEIDAVLFFSPSAVRNFTQMIGTAHLNKVPIAVIGSTTAEAVNQTGLQASIIASSPGVEMLLESIQEYFAQRIQNTP